MQTTSISTDKAIGAAMARLEDERLLVGRGRFAADIHLAGMLEACFVRSPIAHARLRGVDCHLTRALPDIAVFTANDLVGVRPVPDFVTWQRPVGHFPLVRDKVRHVGEAVAVVVAPDRYLAEDAAQTVALDLEALATVPNRDAALAPDAPLLYETWGDNVLGAAVTGNPEATARVFDEPGVRTVSVRCTTQRQGSMPIEPRGLVADWDGERLTVWSATQVPHMVRSLMARVLSLPERRIRVVATDLGGGFGLKSQIHPEEYVIPWLARQLGQPVRWIEDRREHLMSATQARDVSVELEGAFEADGRLRAVRGVVRQDAGTGAIYPSGGACAFVTAGATHGPYRLEQHSMEVQLVVTNKMATGAYRGFGAPEGVFAVERLLDAAATQLGLSPQEIRRRNLLLPADLPYTTPGGTRFATGSHLAAFERAVELGRAALTEALATLPEDSPELLGLGVVPYVQGTAATYYAGTGFFTSQDSCTIRIDSDGGANVHLGIAACGQGAVTMATALAAHALGMPIDDVRVSMGDTDADPQGLGAWGSRGTVVAAGSIAAAATRLVAKAARIAAHLLSDGTRSVMASELEVSDGWFSCREGPSRRVAWSSVAEAALVLTFTLPPGEEPGLEAHAGYLPPGLTDMPTADGKVNACAAYTNQAHAAVVALDPELGTIRVVRYAMVTDCGTVVNPLLVTGQLHGGAAQGIGAALLEELGHDQDAQPLANSLAAYGVPTAVEVGALSVELIESPDPALPFGIKGVGETSISGPPAAIAQAVEQALARAGRAGPPLRDLPFTPSRIRDHIDGDHRGVRP